MKEERITRVTLNEARKMTGRTDWESLRRDDEAGIEPEHDPEIDDVEWDWSKARIMPGIFAGVKLPEPAPKSAISLRVDPDVLAFFKSGGKGYQTRMNAILRAYMEAAKSGQA
ncbi:MAG: BrnA antitoxin family protein [Proteobacteria bacterium]|nr:BrnA antitoxin family protein [Pseudomonadota bacterium]